MRLLKVAPELGQRVALQEYAPGEVTPPYVTMSHCWDNSIASLSLTTANLSHLKQGFSGLKLLRKFRDAIAIARWLQIDYLWIDALCIIQDSSHDWQQQSKVMGNIYAGSLCNIAATNNGPDASCFQERPVDVVEPFCIPNPAQLSADETHVIGYDDFWCNSLLDTNLHTRAWVLQERLLAPRTVHFGKEQIYWECRHTKACEAFPQGIPEQFSNHRTKAWREGEQIFKPKSVTTTQQPTSSLVSALGPAQINSRVDSQSAWSRIVERYMACQLTFASDKLVAVAGLAQKLQEVTQDVYLAGLWNNEYLPQSLLWYVPAAKQTDGRRSVRHPPLGAKHYRAPSWSWASIDGSITWICPARCDQVLINITDARVTPAGDNPVGAVSSAALSLQGGLIPVRIEIMHRHEDGSLNEDGTYMVTARFEDVKSHEEHEEENINNTNGSSPKGTAAAAIKQGIELQPLIYLDTDLSPAVSMDAYILPICTQLRGRTGRVIFDVAGLLVRRAQLIEGANTFERIGMIGLDQGDARLLCGGEPSTLVTEGCDGLLGGTVVDLVLV